MAGSVVAVPVAVSTANPTHGICGRARHSHSSACPFLSTRFVPRDLPPPSAVL